MAVVSEGFLHKGNQFLAGSTMWEWNFVFLQDFSSRNMNQCNKKLQSHIFCLIVPNPFKEVLHIFWIQAPNMMHTITAFARSIISPDRKSASTCLLSRLKWLAVILLQSVGLISLADMITVNEKY